MVSAVAVVAMPARQTDCVACTLQPRHQLALAASTLQMLQATT